MKLSLISKLLPIGLLGAVAVVSKLNMPVDAAEADSAKKSLKVLMFTGGCCHDYENQKKILSAGISERVNAEFTIVHEGGSGTEHEFEMLKKPGWEKGYDLVLWNICFAHNKNKDYVEGITNVIKEGVPGIALHCTMHSHHWKVETDAWEEFLGFTSPNHGPHKPVTITNLKPEHPIMKNFGATWVTGKEELYRQDKLWPTATALAEGTQEGEKNHTCIWVNQFGKARIFGTTIGHYNETMSDPKYLDMLSRAALWVSGHMADDGTPDEAYLPAK